MNDAFISCGKLLLYFDTNFSFSKIKSFYLLLSKTAADSIENPI